MHSPKTALPLLAVLLSLSAGCATSPTAAPPQRPTAPAEMMTPAPPPLYFQTTLEAILSRWPKRLTPLQTGSEPAKLPQ